MKPILMAVALAAFAVPAASEPSYSPVFYKDLIVLGLEREAFLYALRWAGDANSEAELAVVRALLDGIGVEENPMAAVAMACRSSKIDEWERSKLILQANLRLAGKIDGQVQCATVGS
jgi:hypothetical protein